MDLLHTTMFIINCTSLVLLAIGYFKSKFTIVDLETWNTLVEVYNAHAEEDEQEECNNCGGGVGFFYEQLEQPKEDEEEE